MSVYKRGNIYHSTHYDADGKRVRRSTRRCDKKTAEAVEQQWVIGAADPGHAAAQTETLSDVLVRFFEYFDGEVRAGKRSGATLKAYRSKAGHLIRLFETDANGVYSPRLVHGWTAADTRWYIGQRRDEGSGDTTVAKELVPLRTGLALAREAGTWHGDPDAVIPVGFTPHYEPRTRWLPREEVEALMRALVEDKKPHRAAVIAFMVAVSAEASAAHAARRDDIASDQTAVLVHGTKTVWRERCVPIESDDQKRLIRFVLEHADGVKGALFSPWSNMRRDLHAACRAAKIAPCSPNDLRRTFCSWMIQDGVPPLVIAKMMGHADTKMVLRVYGQMRPQDVAGQLRDALRTKAG